MSVLIRKALPEDTEEIWSVLEPTIREGESLAFMPDRKKDEVLSYWMGVDKHTYIALLHGRMAGTFLIKENQPDLGRHITNASYAVDP